MDGGLSTNYAWTIIAPNSTNFDLSGDQSGNGTVDGTCLEITSIPDMPCYPQDITISVYTTIEGERFVDDIIITIVDCEDGEFKNADEFDYFDTYEQMQSHTLPKTNFSDLQIAIDRNSSISNFEYYNLSGQLIYKSNHLSDSIPEFSAMRQLLIVVQKDNSNRIISITKKIFIQ